MLIHILKSILINCPKILLSSQFQMLQRTDFKLWHCRFSPESNYRVCHNSFTIYYMHIFQLIYALYGVPSLVLAINLVSSWKSFSMHSHYYFHILHRLGDDHVTNDAGPQQWSCDQGCRILLSPFIENRNIRWITDLDILDMELLKADD